MPRRQWIKTARSAFRTGPVRLVAGAVLIAAVVSTGLADYSSSSSGGYVVQPGDSLWVIAVAHGTTVAELASANHLDPAAILPVGLHLYLPSSPGSSESSESSPVREVSVETSGSGAGPWSFCSSFVPSPGPWGVLPSRLAASPSRLALRPLFEQWAAHYGVSAPLLEAISWQESGWQQSVVSPTGAVGVGQIEPGTGQFISNILIGEPMNRWSVSDNIRMSAAFLAYLAGQEGNNRCATIAAYYEGPLNLSAHGVFRSTQSYVADVEDLLPRFE